MRRRDLNLGAWAKTRVKEANVPDRYTRPGRSSRAASTADRVIGFDEDKRSTKTFISSERGGMILTLIENRGTWALKKIQKCRLLEDREEAKAAGEDPALIEPMEPEDLLEAYPGLKRYWQIHGQLVEHFASHQGFSVQALVRMGQHGLLEGQHEHDSSVGS